MIEMSIQWCYMLTKEYGVDDIVADCSFYKFLTVAYIIWFLNVRRFH
jgi:hypothetical protein